MDTDKETRARRDPLYREYIHTGVKKGLTKEAIHKIIGHSVPHEIIDRHYQDAMKEQKR